jgi:hypothetical protein
MVVAAATKLRWCLLANACVLATVATIMCLLADGSKYWRFGPSDDLVLVSVQINTRLKYILTILLLTLINASNVVIDEMAMPIISFNVYNPDKKQITGFTKVGLQFYANGMFMLNGFRSIFVTMIAISQIDIAIWNMLSCELTSIFTIRFLLNEKEFIDDQNRDDAAGHVLLPQDDNDKIELVVVQDL